jgi:FkbM family methyltransferase
MLSVFERIAMHIRPAFLGVLIKEILGVQRQEIATSVGRFWVDPVSNFGARLMSDGGYEPEVSGAILQLAETARSFIDIGANEGYFAIIVANSRGVNCRVVAVEPQSRLQEVIKRNLSLNGVEANLEQVQCAVSDHDGKARLFLSPSVNTGSSGLVRATRYRVKTEEVEVMTIQSLMHQLGMQTIDLMKIDIEGFEYEAIFGSKSIFESKRVASIVVEVHSQAMRQRGKEPDDISDFFRKCGYERVYSSGTEIWQAT